MANDTSDARKSAHPWKTRRQGVLKVRRWYQCAMTWVDDGEKGHKHRICQDCPVMIGTK